MKHLLLATIAATLTLAVSSCKQADEPQQEKQAAVAIDGQFKDWTTLINEKKATSVTLASTKTYNLKGINQLTVYVDESDIYFFIKYDEGSAYPLDIFLATKGEVPTDAINLWSPCYVDYLIEFGKGDTFVDDPADMDWKDWSYQQLMAYDHAKGGWNWTNISQNMVTVSDKVSYGGLYAVEGKISRQHFTFTTNYFYMGAFISNINWAATGAQPAAEKVDEQIILPPMLQIMLP